MAYFESITAGRGGLDSFNQALNNQRYANLLLNESMGNFANTIANAGSLFDNAKIREEALKYQRMRDLANDKKQAQAFDLQKRQAEQSMDFAKRQQRMSEESHKQNQVLNNERLKAIRQENRLNEDQYQWLKKAMPNAKASAVVDNNAKTPTTPKTQGTPITTPKTPKTITKEEFKAFINSPFYR
ncbi:hypothetical protein BB415_06790 [Helicobacter pylori]|uniref:hypothetical protein n=1 Tax=Helicobacter pylori TaxID=210 RepID=UPI00099327A4|nr:hypothetical protein [Helicobacter pylori]OOP82723.1 hypothetical protein B0X24_08070 [Helicobacter pylori]PDX19486.1 hypothetical protein BB415_06790 [Helicobacter pylori]